MNGQERRDFVRKHRTCVFGYPRKEHGPAMSVVYYVMDGEDILVSTMAERGKAKAVRRNPRITLCVLDENWPLSYLQVFGEAHIEPDEDAELLKKICEVMAEGPIPESKARRAGRHGEARTAHRAADQTLCDVRDAAAPRLQARRHRYADTRFRRQPSVGRRLSA